MSNYPPGVTGNEFEIAGPNREYEEVRECTECGEEVEMLVQTFHNEAWADCPSCHAANEWELHDE